MTRQELVTKIIAHTRHTGAASLIEPDFGRFNATINPTIDEVNRGLILEISFPTIAEDIKTTSCPGWAHRPSQVFDGIRQVHTDAMGNITHITVQAYGEWMFAGRRAMGHDTWEICVATHFFNNLAQETKDHISLTYTPGLIARDPSSQNHVIKRILVLATASKRQISRTKSLIATITNLALMTNNFPSSAKLLLLLLALLPLLLLPL